MLKLFAYESSNIMCSVVTGEIYLENGNIFYSSNPRRINRIPQAINDFVTIVDEQANTNTVGACNIHGISSSSVCHTLGVLGAEGGGVELAVEHSIADSLLYERFSKST
ncbi:hypothetical protein NPIL_594801 [Nephila pilipes]|uniref:Uncharacterized protein n=1 Tax=Nephila pilipes TaxID=299642 RepID=A0A8X6P1U8_NEPPI|nr:hypothetical protein NPIL_594801 [Nephila pilipes]